MLNLLAVLILLLILPTSKKKNMEYVTIKNGVATPIERKQLYYLGHKSTFQFYSINEDITTSLLGNKLTEEEAKTYFDINGKVACLDEIIGDKAKVNIYYNEGMAAENHTQGDIKCALAYITESKFSNDTIYLNGKSVPALKIPLKYRFNTYHGDDFINEIAYGVFDAIKPLNIDFSSYHQNIEPCYDVIGFIGYANEYDLNEQHINVLRDYLNTKDTLVNNVYDEYDNYGVDVDDDYVNGDYKELKGCAFMSYTELPDGGGNYNAFIGSQEYSSDRLLKSDDKYNNIMPTQILLDMQKFAHNKYFVYYNPLLDNLKNKNKVEEYLIYRAGGNTVGNVLVYELETSKLP